MGYPTTSTRGTKVNLEIVENREGIVVGNREASTAIIVPLLSHNAPEDLFSLPSVSTQYTSKSVSSD